MCVDCVTVKSISSENTATYMYMCFLLIGVATDIIG